MLNRERGSVLFLFPAAMSVMVVLAALTVDVGYVHVRGRELQTVAESAANDTLAALDLRALRAGAGIHLEEQRLRAIVGEAIAHGPLPEAGVVAISVTPDATGDAREVAVTLRLEFDLVMAPALGDLDRVVLTRTGHAVILRG